MKTATRQIRCTPEQHAAWVTAAEAKGVTVSAFIRETLDEAAGSSCAACKGTGRGAFPAVVT